MYLLILFLPFLSFLCLISFGRYIGRAGGAIISTSSIFICAFLSTIAFYEVTLAASPCYVQLGSWIDCAILHAS
jgi:NADH:ubiquinone oxidoreductase subunit 5 (subunit L)/multisubunit Na+/H+ antiporter MnhA subunit